LFGPQLLTKYFPVNDASASPAKVVELELAKILNTAQLVAFMSDMKSCVKVTKGWKNGDKIKYRF
jgi:hypothetical protein